VNAQAWAAVIAGVGIVMSMVGAAMVVSYRVGRVEAELRASASSAQAATAVALTSMAEKLARIEGMFELRLKDWPGGAAPKTGVQRP
jgi:cytochrome c biogenesis factor